MAKIESGIPSSADRDADEDDRTVWNHKYGAREWRQGEEPASWLTHHVGPLAAPNRGTPALDLACGEGRHSVYLAVCGYTVDAVDAAELGLARGIIQGRRLGLNHRIRWRQADLRAPEAIVGQYALICNFYYLERALWPRLETALEPGGLLVFESYTARQNALRPAGRPMRRDHLLEEGELQHAFPRLEVLHYREGIVHAIRRNTKAIASLVARKRRAP